MGAKSGAAETCGTRGVGLPYAHLWFGTDPDQKQKNGKPLVDRLQKWRPQSQKSAVAGLQKAVFSEETCRKQLS